MSSVCISNCVNDARDPRVPVRATYVNLYKWPESDAEFVRSVSSSGSKPTTTAGAAAGAVRFGHPRVVESISCRQMYLRSYKFSREDHDDQQKKKAQKCFGCAVLNPKLDDVHDLDDHAEKGKKQKTKEKKKNSRSRGSGPNVSNKKNKNKKKRCLFLGKVKEISYAAVFGIFQRCLSCTATVDVVDQQD